MKGQHHQELKKEDSYSDIGPKTDFIEEIAMREIDNDHPKYGNMPVLLETDRILITLGPDCKHQNTQIYAFQSPSLAFSLPITSSFLQ